MDEKKDVKGGKLSDDELDAVAGGNNKPPSHMHMKCRSCGYYDTTDKFAYHMIGMYKCPNCGSESLESLD